MIVLECAVLVALGVGPLVAAGYKVFQRHGADNGGFVRVSSLLVGCAFAVPGTAMIIAEMFGTGPADNSMLLGLALYGGSLVVYALAVFAPNVSLLATSKS